MEGKCKTEFDCTVEQLPELITDFDAETEKSITKAEVILGIKKAPAVEVDEAEVDEDALA